MFEVFSVLFCILLIHEVIGCIPINDYIMIPATDICAIPLGPTSLFIENEVELAVGPSMELGMKEAIGECNGAVKYYDGKAPADWWMAMMQLDIGT